MSYYWVRPHPKSKVISKLLTYSIVILLCITPVSAKEALNTAMSFDELIVLFIDNIYEAVNTQLTDKEQFVEDFESFKSNLDAMLGGKLSEMGLIVLNYAETEKTNFAQIMEEEQLFDDYAALAENLLDLIGEYPRLDDMLIITSPHVFEFEDVLKNSFPEYELTIAGGNPFSNIYNYYQTVEQENPLDLGPIFRIEFLNNSSRFRSRQEISVVSTVSGVEEENIIFRETNEYNDEVLVFHEVIVDNEVTEFMKTIEDFSVFHGIPDQMMQDGVDEKIVLFVEEHLKLINYHLNLAFESEGLDIPIDHPQLVVDPNYTPDDFVDNLVNILMDFSDDGVSLLAVEDLTSNVSFALTGFDSQL